jgi:hypothetical protein
VAFAAIIRPAVARIAVQRVACAERFAAALAGAVAAGDRVRPLLVCLDRALLRIE